MSKPVILTGLRATNDLHIGNYFGALLPLIDIAKNKSKDYQVNLFMPDLHSLTTPIEYSGLQKQIMDTLKQFVAAGLPLDNDNVHIYRQSMIGAVSELTLILDCFTGFGELSKMTQFREKSFAAVHERTLATILGPVAQSKKTSISTEEAKIVINIFNRLTEAHGNIDSYAADAINMLRTNKLKLQPTQAHSIVRAYQDKTIFNKEPSQKGRVASVGLFNYPVLMAADILVYDAKYVPVGDDQTQHLEFTRDLATRMKNQFGDLFIVPEPVAKQHEFFGKEQGLRIKDLVDPTKKMSKSDDNEKGVIFLTDKPEDAVAKIMSATTDNVGAVHYDIEKQPGISNLLQIHALLSDESIEKVAKHHDGQESYGELKKEVAEQVKEFLTKFQSELSKVDESALMKKLEASEKVMNEVANAKLEEVQVAVGLRSK